MEAIQVAGALIQGAGGMEAGKYNRDVYNAQAGDELAVGNAEALRVRDLARAQMGLQAAGQAESGFAPGTGSSLRMLEESAINAELDILNIRRAAEGRAAALRAQAKMAKKEGQMAMTAAMFGSAGHVVAARNRRSEQRSARRSASEEIRANLGNYGGG